MHFVHHEQAAPAAPSLVDEEGLERDQQLRLRDPAHVDAESGAHHAQRVFRLQLGGDQLADVYVGVAQRVEQTGQDGRLAGADLAGDDDEALVARNAVLQVRLRPAMLLAV